MLVLLFERESILEYEPRTPRFVREVSFKCDWHHAQPASTWIQKTYCRAIPRDRWLATAIS